MAKSVLLLRTLELLRTRQSMTIAELSAELGRSERTVYRYLADLACELQAPIYCKNGSYQVATRNDSLCASNLTADEALAVHVALTSAAMSSSSPFHSAAQSALRKIKSTVRDPAWEELQDAQKKHIFAPSVFSGYGHTPKVINDAVRQNKRLKLVYRSQNSGETDSFLVDPYGLAFRRHSWYLVAYSHKHNRIVQLKLVRIQEAEETGEVFERPDEFSLEDFYSSSWEVWTGSEETQIKVRFSPRMAPMIRENSYHPTQMLEDTPDGGVVFTVTVAGVQEIGSWILGFGADAEVIEPEPLRAFTHQTARDIVALYENENWNAD